MSLFNELKRRNVVRVGVAYAAAAWLILQLTDVIGEILELPSWSGKLILLILVVGFFITLFAAWAFELTPEGIKRDHEVGGNGSSARPRSRTFDGVIVLVVLVALGGFAWNRFGPQPAEPGGTTAANEADHETADRKSPEKPVIAVLPFFSTGSEDGGFLATGLYDDLLTRLAQLDAFEVISRTSMMGYADRSKSMRQIGEELGAAYILEGGVQSRGMRLRINAQLIHAPSDRHVWAETYDRAMSVADLFDIQAELAAAIAGAARTTLSPEERAILGAAPTKNLEAYSAYLRGIGVLARLTGVGGKRWQEAIAAFAEAVRLDPDFALAWARLAGAHIGAAGNAFDQQASDDALAALAEARKLQPGLLEADVAWAEYQYRQLRDYDQALETLAGLGTRIAGHSEALTLKAVLLRRTGRYEESYRVMREDVWRLEPRTWWTLHLLSEMAVHIGACGDARQYLEVLESIDSEAVLAQAAYFELECNGDSQRAADLVRGHGWVFNSHVPVSWCAATGAGDVDLARALAAQSGEIAIPDAPFWQQMFYWEIHTHLQPDARLAADALDQAGRYLETSATASGSPGDNQQATMALYYHAARGEVEKTLDWIDRLGRIRQREMKGDLLALQIYRAEAALSLARVGLQDEAVAEMKTLLEEPGPFRFPLLQSLPDFDVLRDHPEYMKLRDTYGRNASRGEN